jgi:hypothetical protein
MLPRGKCATRTEAEIDRAADRMTLSLGMSREGVFAMFGGLDDTPAERRAAFARVLAGARRILAGGGAAPDLGTLLGASGARPAF